MRGIGWVPHTRATQPKGRKMIRNLKAPWLALVAVAILATTAFTVSAVLAAEQGTLAADGPVKLTGTDSTSVATAFGQKVECHNHGTGGNVGETPPGFITPPVTEFTVESQSTNCVASIGAIKVPATVTMNGCDGVTHLGKTVEGGKWGGTADIVCPVGKQIEIHAYNNAEHKSSVCTYKIPPQTGLSGGFVQNLTGGTITISGTSTGIKAAKEGILCGGKAETNSAEAHADVVVSGTNEAGNPTAIEIVD